MNFITIKLPAKMHVLLLEDSPMRIAWFKKQIPNLTVVNTVEQFRQFFKDGNVTDFFFLDHDLGSNTENGSAAAKFIVETFGNANKACLIHSYNKAGADIMRSYLPFAQHIPFGEFDIEYAAD